MAMAGGASPAAGQVLNFRQYGSSDGLPQVQIMALHQDRMGYMWFGSYGGLTRYDGRVFTTWTAADGLSSNSIIVLDEGPDGGLVAGTLGGGVCFVGPPIRCVGPAEGLAHEDVRNVAWGPDDHLWVATEGGVSRLASGRVVASYGPDEGLDGLVYWVEVGPDGGVWAGTADGVHVLDGTVFIPDPVGPLGGLPAEVAAWSDGSLVVGGAGVLVRRGADGAVPLALPGIPPGTTLTDLAVDAGGLWVASRAGVVRVAEDGSRHLSTRQGLGNDEVNRILPDQEGNVWFGTENGASKLVVGPMTLYTEAEGLPNPFVRALAEDASGRLWAGTREGLAYFDGDRWATEPLPVEGVQPRVYGLAVLPPDGLLVGTRNGLYHREGSRWRSYRAPDGLPDDFVTAVHPDGAGGAWIGTAAGLARWRDGKLEGSGSPETDQAFVLSLALTPAGALYVGLRAGGVVVMEPTGVRVIGEAEGFSDQSVWSLDATPDGGVWAGTNGEGAFYLTPDSVRRVSGDDGLINDFVWQVLRDSRDEVWFFTSRGLDRLTDRGVIHYGRGQGLLDLEGTADAALEVSDGSLWFGAGTGVYRYEPSLDVPATVPPRVHVESLASGAGPHPLEGARIPPRSGVVRVRFSSPSFRDEDETRFRWRLAGTDSTWSPPSDEATLSLAGLPPGSYLLEAVAEGPGGVRSADAARVGFTVLPSFWQTLWFRGGLVLLLGIPFIGVPHLRARRLESERRRLNELVDTRTAELRENNRLLEVEVGERKNAEVALRVSEGRIRDILEHSTNLFYVRSRAGRLTYVSPQARRFLGYDPPDTLRWDDLLTDHPTNETARAATRAAIETGRRQPTYELELARGDGGTLWVEVNEAPVIRGGAAVSIVGALTDITDAKRAADDRDRLEIQLRQAQKLEAVGRLAGGIAHDFNNLLTSVVGHAQLASEEIEPDAGIQTDLDEIQRAARRGAELVDQLLAFSRRQIVQCREVDVGQAVQDAMRMLRRLIGADVDLLAEIAEGPMLVEIDPTQLDQVLMNLAVNARDAMPGGGSLTISVVRARVGVGGLGPDRVPPGDYVCVRVSDQGVGMDEATLQHVFEPFYTTKPPGQGTGLGLATVYGVLRQHHGYIQVRSVPDQGTEFFLYVPRASAGSAVSDGGAAVAGVAGVRAAS